MMVLFYSVEGAATMLFLISLIKAKAKAEIVLPSKETYRIQGGDDFLGF